MSFLLHNEYERDIYFECWVRLFKKEAEGHNESLKGSRNETISNIENNAFYLEEDDDRLKWMQK